MDETMDINQLMKAFPTRGGFLPFAYYDKHLDCIRVQLKDCSFTERRSNRFITVLTENHVTQSKNIGFSIKGIRYLFEKIGLGLTGVHTVAEILNKLVKVYPAPCPVGRNGRRPAKRDGRLEYLVMPARSTTETMMEKLNAGQKHMLKLIDRDKDGEGWAKVSSVVMPLLENTMPAELIELAKNDDGAGRARLTEKGRGIVDAMAWLL